MLKLMTLAAVVTALARGMTHKESNENWDFACEQIEEFGYSCEGLEAPNVVVSEVITLLPGTRGLYVPGEDQIFIHPRLKDPNSTIIHEMVHYIMYKNDNDVDRCYSEEVARFVSGGRWDDQVKELYGCQNKPKLYRA